MSYWKSAVVSLLTGVMIASSAIQPVAIYAETVSDEGGQADSAQDGSVQADGTESDRSTSDEPVDSEAEASQDADEAPGSASTEMGEGAASTDELAVAQDDVSEAEESVAAEDASEANTMASRTLVENSWRYQNGQRIESLDDESAPSGDFLSRAMDPLPDGATAQGIDVSEFQGKIDWDAVKAAGVDFAILRIGYGDQNAGDTDKYFKRNVEECERLGIKWGAYLYSYSVNTKEAADEAAHVLSEMKGLTPDLPIYYDMEDDSTLGAKDRFADIAQTFCSKIEAAGYDAGVYAGARWWKYYLTSPVFDSWSKWSAQYYKICEYPSDPDAWQYTSQGKVPGISGNVDVNYAYEGLVPGSVAEANQHISTHAHVADIGWQNQAALDGETAGTVGKAKSIEALKITLVNQVKTGSVQVRAHVSNEGWQDWTSGTAGTTGRGLPIEAVQVRLTGEMAESYDVYYRVHAANIGWMGWARDGEEAGTQGYACGVEAVQVLLVEKGGQAPSSSGSATPEAFRRRPVDVSVRAHVSGIGWQGAVRGGATAGTTGRALAVEALQVGLTDQQLAGSVQVRAHVSNVGWQDWTSGTAGTTGRGLPIEAVQARLTGDMAESYDVYYRAHVSNIGWLDWAKDGATAGTVGLSAPVEAVQVKLVKKGASAPGSTARPSLEMPVIALQTSTGSALSSAVGNNAVSGSTGSRTALNAIKLSVQSGVSGGVSYQVHVSNAGWLGSYAGGSVAGGLGSANRVQAVRFSFTGELSKYFDIWYRVYVQDVGWLGWARNGATAGTTGAGQDVTAIQVSVRACGSAVPSSGSYGPYYVGGVPQALAAGSAMQKRVVESARTVPRPGPNMCAEWVARVFDNIGLGNVHMDAYEYYWNFCTSSRPADLKVGMVVSVPSHGNTVMGSRYGHVCIYVGDGLVMDNADGRIRTLSLEWWTSHYGTTYAPKWGWYRNAPLL
ncbi:GH25 family lysozyme [Collinsella phocaeensis]|uniref:GH25 family lysozyme n=1 Tax=Collinsella phocaeensis TaxID=1871016 RepID=UPI000930F842|nr:GH25 family lysozyme [Collinsella phocaeensis]